MLHMLYFYVAKAILVCCMDRPMGDVPIGRPDASSAVNFLDDRKILFATPGQMTLEFTSIPRHEDPILSY